VTARDPRCGWRLLRAVLLGLGVVLLGVLGVVPGPAPMAPAAHAAPLAAPPEGARVSRIEVRGSERVEEATVLAVLDLSRGARITRSGMRAVVKAVYATGFFDDVRVLLEEAGDGYLVIIEVDEKPAVREVKIVGNKKVNEEDITEVLDIRAFSVLNDADLQENAARIRELYVEKGYYLVEVDPEVVYIEEDQVELTFRITENRKVVVQKVEFVGNENVPASKFRRFLQVKEGGVLAFLGSGGTFQRDKLDMDKETIRYILWEEGYLDARVSSPKVFLSPDKRYIYITYQIDEGIRYDVGHIALSGDFVPEEGLTEEAVRRITQGTPVQVIQEEQWREANDKPPKLRLLEVKGPRLEKGDAFTYSTLQAVSSAIQSLYQDQGYAFVNVSPTPVPNPRTGQADIIFRIQRGRKYRIGRIEITGNDPTHDKVIRREIQVDEEDVYRGGRLQGSRARIQRLGFFESVDLSTPRSSEEDVLDVNIKVAEQPTGSFSAGLGFSNLEQFVLTGSISKNNFLGLGYTMSAMINWSAIRQQWQLQFFDPYLADTRWTLRFNAYSVNQQFQLDEFQRGGSFELGRYLDRQDDVRLSLQYTLENVGVLGLDPYRRRLMGGDLFRNGWTSTVGINFILDQRNNRIRATQGIFVSAAANLSGGVGTGDGKALSLLGGEFNFVELRGNFRWYQPLIKDTDKLVFRMNSTLGWVQSTDGRVVPFIHRYRAGGINSVRGYQWFSLGPTLRVLGSDDPTVGDDSIPVGGTQTWINNFELEAPVIRGAGISAVVFFDAGNAFGDPWGRGGINPLELRFAAGLGVRWLSPMGPLRFEYGIPLGRRPGERRAVFDFGMGSFF
jgi:outer membrane protein insertion porin family